MSKVILGWAVVAVLSVLIMDGPVLAADPVDITGKFKVEGTGPSGKYAGTAEITKKGEAYFVTWKIGEDDDYQGVGLLEDNVLSVSYFGGINGILVYKVEKGPKLVGKWTFSEAKGQIFTETLTK